MSNGNKKGFKQPGFTFQIPPEIHDSLQMYNKQIKIMDKGIKTENDYNKTQKKLWEYRDWRKSLEDQGINIPDSSNKEGEYNLPPWTQIKKDRRL